MNTKYAIVLIAAAIMVGVTSTQLSFGQEIQIVEGINFSTEQVVFIIIIGSFAGVVKAWQGYDKSPNDFDFPYFINGVRDAILISIPAAFAVALGMPEINAVGYVIVFFSVVGGTSFAQAAKKKSIPSNATEEEIQEILDKRG